MLASFTALQTAPLHAASGATDSTFDTDGIATVAFRLGAYGNAMAIQSDGKIVIAGQYFNSINFDIIVVRFNANGTPDTSFSGDGKLTTGFGGSDGQASGVAVRASGKIVCTGVGAGKIAVTRYHPGGGLDGTFGSGGIVTTAVGSSSSGSAVVIQKNGRIVVAGQNYNGSTNLLTVLRYTSLPQADTRLGTNTAVPTGDDNYNLTGSVQTVTATIRHGGGVKRINIGIQNDGPRADSFTIRGTPGNSKFAVKYFKGSQNVTAAVVGGTFTTGSLAPGQVVRLKAKITATTNLSGQQRILAISSSSNSGTSKDVAKIKARSN